MNIASILVVFGWAVTFVPAVNSARILAVELTGGRSHWNFMSSVVRSLMDTGRHELTVLTPFLDIEGCELNNNNNCMMIDTSKDFYSPYTKGLTYATVAETLTPTASFMSLSANFVRHRCNNMYDNDDVKEILKAGNGSGYDVLLIEPMVSECPSHLAAELGIPVVYLIPSPMITFAEPKFFGHIPNPSVVSSVMTRHAIPRTFAQRFANSVLSAYALILAEYHEWAIKKSQPRPYDLFDTVKPSIVFVNTHYITEKPRPMTPNCIPIGGVHLSRPADNLPKDILEFIEDSPHGVIYFTFGSVVLMSTLPDHVQNAFREALAQVPQRVLWKYEGEMKDKPKNVMTSKWFPQRDILMHPKVKLFISHGGISGVYEAVDAGVPVLGFPLYYDQPRNIENLVEAGMAISMDLSTVKTDLFLKNILEIINNENYTKNAKIASDIFKDRPMTPAQSVVYWTEYVIRHKGAPHLKSQALNLTWYQYFLLDVIAVVLIVIFLVFSIIITIFKFIYKFFSLNKKEIKTKSE